MARSNLGRAADILGEIGSLPDEAYVRLGAAERLLGAGRGRRTEAEEQLEKALAFYRSVAATRYIDNAMALSATPA